MLQTQLAGVVALSHCSLGAELVWSSWGAQSEQGPGSANGMYQQVVCVRAPVAIKAVFMVRNRSRSWSFDGELDLGWEGLTPMWLWLQPPVSSLLPLAGSPAGPLPHPAFHRPLPTLQENSSGCSVAQKEQILRQTQLWGCPWPQSVPVSCAAQLRTLIPNKNRAGTVVRTSLSPAGQHGQE